MNIKIIKVKNQEYSMKNTLISLNLSLKNEELRPDLRFSYFLGFFRYFYEFFGGWEVGSLPNDLNLALSMQLTHLYIEN
jgi:hypothetical protein